MLGQFSCHADCARVFFFSFNERASFPRRRHFLAGAPLPPPTPSPPPPRVMQSPSRAETRCRGRRRSHQVAPLPHPPFSRIGGARHSGGAGGGATCGARISGVSSARARRVTRSRVGATWPPLGGGGPSTPHPPPARPSTRAA